VRWWKKTAMAPLPQATTVAVAVWKQQQQRRWGLPKNWGDLQFLIALLNTFESIAQQLVCIPLWPNSEHKIKFSRRQDVLLFFLFFLLPTQSPVGQSWIQSLLKSEKFGTMAKTKKYCICDPLDATPICECGRQRLR
jgi:hypothetical protein